MEAHKVMLKRELEILEERGNQVFLIEINRHIFLTLLYYLAENGTDMRYLSGNVILSHIMPKRHDFLKRVWK